MSRLDDLWRRIERGVANEAERQRTARLAGEVVRPEDRDRLLALLEDPDEDVRAVALRSLVVERDDLAPPIESWCWAMLESDPSEDVRARAAVSLGKILWPKPSVMAFRRLVEALRSGQQPLLAQAALYETLFRLARRPPLEWPRLFAKRMFRREDMDWQKVEELEREVEALELGGN